MKERNKEKWLKGVIQSVMEAVEVEVEIRQENSGVNMSYNFIRNTVGFDPRRIQKAREELQIPISLELYIKIFTLHELGHAIDQEALVDSLPRTIEIFEMKKGYSLNDHYNHTDFLAVLIEEHEMNIAFEETAWKNAENLNKQYNIVEWARFEKVKTHSLATYTSLYEDDLHLYNKLMAEHSEQIA